MFFMHTIVLIIFAFAMITFIFKVIGEYNSSKISDSETEIKKEKLRLENEILKLKIESLKKGSSNP